MTEKLSERSCVPCEGGVDPLEGNAVAAMVEKIDDGWEVVEGHHLHREFDLEDFQEALDFTNRVGEIAEEEDHHPVIHLTWGEVKLDIWTHAIDGLSENDFILAAKVDELYDDL
ncbi:MAG: 4a-hydroxytetrahydrobiopterin dehydratase [Thermoanaerobaculia bacterium]|nr:4a-hydroxytetrahydrobiopterin dehydratase [Thermoanaerobaculia bacterium]